MRTVRSELSRHISKVSRSEFVITIDSSPNIVIRNTYVRAKVEITVLMYRYILKMFTILCIGFLELQNCEVQRSAHNAGSLYVHDLLI